MSILGNQSQGKENKGSALTIGKEARDAKALNPAVIDSTIGMLFDEDGKFYTFKMVEKIINELTPRQKFGYPATAGDNKFHEAIKHWVFRDFYNDITSKMETRVVATPGGTGAICATLTNYLSLGDKALFPNYMWGNYTQLAREANLGYDTYELFDNEGNFNADDLRKKCNEMKNAQGRVLVVINDPCQNPTGYIMKYTEWMQVVDIANTVSRDGTPFILLYDMAYIDYDSRGFEASRKNIDLLTNLGENAIAILAFSGSKTLGLYGLRIGAQLAICKNKADADEFFQANEYSGRGKWSSSSMMGMNIITETLDNHKEEFEKELDYARNLLMKRANTFIEEAKKNNVKSLPYQCGFFVTIPCDNPKAVFEELKTKGVYILPLKGVIRVTLSSITCDEIKRVVKAIAEVLNK